MRRGIDFLILVAGTFYLALIYKSNSLIFLGYAEIFLVFMLFIYNMMGLFLIQISLEAPLGITECGKKVPIKIKIQNYSRFPTGRISVQLLEFYALFGKKKKTVFYTSVAGKQLNEECGVTVVHAEWNPGYTGKVVMRVRKARCFDLLGTLALPLPKKAYQGAEVITVMPSIYPVPVEIGDTIRNFAAEQERYLQNDMEETVTEQFQIRSYQPGDRIRSIHWKLSAKEDEWMVKEYLSVRGCPVLFFLEMTDVIGWRERRKEAENRENFFTVVVSLSKSMLQKECIHYVIWYDDTEQDVLRYRVEKEEDIYILLARIHSIGKLPEKLSLEEEYYEKYHEKSYAGKLVLDRKLRLNCNDEQVICYRKRELEESLASETVFL